MALVPHYLVALRVSLLDTVALQSPFDPTLLRNLLLFCVAALTRPLVQDGLESFFCSRDSASYGQQPANPLGVGLPRAR